MQIEELENKVVEDIEIKYLVEVERIIKLLQEGQTMHMNVLEMIRVLRQRIEILESKICN